MSSLRNAVQRRNHRERAQPTERKKWGLLEKHKDYSLRAADHNLKKRKLRALQSKAADRNEDEFYFGMMSSSSAGGVKRAKRGEENSGGSGGKSLSVNVVKLMKTQDAGYLRTVLQSTRHERERVRREVVGMEEGVSVATGASTLTGARRMVFGEGGEDVEVRAVPGVSDMDDLDGLDGSDDDDNEAGPNEEADATLTPEERTLRQRKRHTLDVKRRQFDGLRDREEQLSAALMELDDQRARMSGGSGGVNKNGVKFKARQRKR